MKELKLDNRRTILVGLAFLSICSFWQMYDNLVPLILRETFRLDEAYTGAIMAADNILALFLLPFFGGHRRGGGLDEHPAHPGQQLRPGGGPLQAGELHHCAGPAADLHGHLSLSCRGPDAGRHPKALALQG